MNASDLRRRRHRRTQPLAQFRRADGGLRIEQGAIEQTVAPLHLLNQWLWIAPDRTQRLPRQRMERRPGLHDGTGEAILIGSRIHTFPLRELVALHESDDKVRAPEGGRVVVEPAHWRHWHGRPF